MCYFSDKKIIFISVVAIAIYIAVAETKRWCTIFTISDWRALTKPLHNPHETRYSIIKECNENVGIYVHIFSKIFTIHLFQS